MPKSLAAPLRSICQALGRKSLQGFSDRDLLDQFARGNEAAFAALVERHGPMVRGACLRVLRDSHLADDALQATFVILVRKSRSVRRPNALAGWLFGVARNIAAQMRRSRDRQRRREQAAANLRPEAEPASPCDDLLRTLDEELHCLPERFRAPLVACYLQGRTQDEAAGELGWTLITLRRRLAAGRDRLRSRMERRGATFSAGLIAAALTTAADASIPAAIGELTLTHALAALHDQPLPAALAELVRSDESIASFVRPRLWLLPLVAASVLVGVGALRPSMSKPPAAAIPEPPAAKPQEALRDRFNDPLPRGAVARLGTVSLRHGPGLHKLAFG